MRTAIWVVAACAAGLLAAAPLMSAPPVGGAAPLDFMVTKSADQVHFSWAKPAGEEPVYPKYSVDVEGTITYSDGQTRDTAVFEYDFGTMDGIGTYGERSGRLVLSIPEQVFVRLVLVMLEEQGVDRSVVVGFRLDASAAVKGLDPGKNKGPQNNQFSNSDTFDLTWVRPG